MDHDHTRANPQTSAPERARRIVFISHANSEDNPAAAWFATQLTLMGYEVWCDLKNILAGKSEFWLNMDRWLRISASGAARLLDIRVSESLLSPSCGDRFRRGDGRGRVM